MTHNESCYDYYLNTVFPAIAPTKLLREFQSIVPSASLLIEDNLQQFYDTIASDSPITRAHQQQLDTVKTEAFALIAITDAVTNYGKKVNPFKSIKPSRRDLAISDRLQQLSEYDEIFSLYLNFELPSRTGESFFSSLRGDIKGTLSHAMITSSLALALLADENPDRKTLHEVAEGNLLVFKRFRPMIDAAAEFERQQFGE